MTYKDKERENEYMKRYREEHKKEIKEYKKKYYQEHKNEIKEAIRPYGIVLYAHLINWSFE